MICPKCNQNVRFATKDSRPRDWGVKRVRECPNCHFRVPTIEVYSLTEEALSSLGVSQYLVECRARGRKSNEKI